MPSGEETSFSTFFHKRSERHCLSHCPVDHPVVGHLVPGLEDPLNPPVDLEVGGVRGSGGKLVCNVTQSLLVNSSGTGLYVNYTLHVHAYVRI